MPVIDHFRKQAKLYLRWHRQGYFPVAAQIRRHLARFADLTDREILETDFRLSDAQELVARKAGYDDWQALKKGIDDMPASSAQFTPKATLLHAEPQLFVSDLEGSLQYYCARLGFSVAFAYGEPPFYAQVFRDGARLNLRWTSRPVFDPEFTKNEPDPLSATIAVDAAKPLFLEFEQKGVEFRQRLRSEPWGARTFIIRDPDGNLICFAGGTDEPQ
jgi:catechol 2,3-dioxygenase-like lactoylglutathione lyase family enzyme